MASNPSRRYILTSSIALAAGATLPSLGPVNSAMADSASPTAAEIIAAIRSKQMTAVSAVQAAIARAEQMKDLNAFIILNKDGALAAAAQVDKGEKTGALAGLPIVIKDNINTAGLPTSAGTPALQNARPTRNAPSLQKLLDAGAVVIGKTNMHELAFGITSTNLSSFAGPVKNPYDKTTNSRRLVRRNLGSHCGAHRQLRTGIGYRRLDAGAGGTDRNRRAAAVGRRWRRRAPLSRRQHGGPDQPHPRYRRSDGPHRRGRCAAGCGDHRHRHRHRGATARQAPGYSRRVLERTGPRRRGRDEGCARKTRRRRRRSCRCRYARAVRAERQGLVPDRAA